MPLLGFKKQFAKQVLSGNKKQTIRIIRKRPFKVGDRLYIYAGLRTISCVKLGEAEVNKVNHIIIINPHNPGRFHSCRTVRVDEDFLSICQTKALAKEDGFNNIEEFFDFFKTPSGVFEGQLIKWKTFLKST